MVGASSRVAWSERALGSGTLGESQVVWVVGSVALVAFDPLGLTLAGRVAVIGIALCVADFALLQALGLGRLRRAPLAA